eukprot:1613986-Amphidinium_carterae.1
MCATTSSNVHRGLGCQRIADSVDAWQGDSETFTHRDHRVQIHRGLPSVVAVVISPGHCSRLFSSPV